MNRKPGTGKNAVNLALLKWSKRKFPRGLNHCAFFYVPSVFTWKMVVSPPEPPPRGLRHHHPLTWTTNQPGTSANFHSCSPRRHFCPRRPVLTMQINPIRTLLHTLCCLSGKAQPDLSATSLSPLISYLPPPWFCTSHTWFSFPQAGQFIPAPGPLQQLFPPAGALLAMDASFTRFSFQVQCYLL